ncbi:MAG TPA: DUF1015 domain-containing protein [Actinomycetota bacterium]|nr:DUF1015 domain-containing protein [Actinomycetota bacterium]
MATVLPFRGILFDPTRVPDAGAVTCPPYDVISDADRVALYDRHPYNVVRIISGRREPGDGPGENAYSRAAAFFDSWLWEGVLRQDAEPALYVYRQAFQDPSRRFRRVWGLVATIRLDDPVLAHENTMAGPKADRLALMEALPVNISPIYALYSRGGISHRLRHWAGESPAADFTDDEGTRHTVWPARDPGFHREVAAALRDCPVMIADGHHRFQTARDYRDGHGAGGPADQIMALLVDAAEEAVCILPYHRIVRSAGTSDVLPVLERAFDVEKLDDPDPDRIGLELWDDDRPGVFIAFTSAGAFRLVSREPEPDEIPASILRRLALHPLGATSAQDHLSFTPRPPEVAEEVRSGRAVCGFLIQPVSVDRVWRLAETGAQMPEKSTYFHPKPKDGIVMRSLRQEDPAPPA